MLPALVWAGSIFAQSSQVTVVDHPSMSATNAHYVNSRQPLRQVAFIKLPVGSIKPHG